MGVNLHLKQREEPEDWPVILPLVEDLGVRWVREEFFYPNTDYDDVLNDYTDYHFKIVALVKADAYPDLDAWQNYLEELLNNYGDQIKYWEIWNESNLDLSYKQYARLLKKSYKKIKSLNPQAKVIFGGTSGTDTDFIQRVVKLMGKEYFDIVAIHPYRTIDSQFIYPPGKTYPGLNSLDVDINNVQAITDKPVWITEFGYPTCPKGVSKKKQAKYLQRSLEIVQEQGVKKFFWYEFKDRDSESKACEDNFGLIKSDLTKKKSFNVYSF